MKKGGQYVKPFIDDAPYLLFKRKKDAEATLIMDRQHKVVKVRVTIQPINVC